MTSRKKGISLKQYLKDAVRAGTKTPARRRRYIVSSQSLGARQEFDIDKASQLAGELDDRELESRLQ